MKVKMFSVTFTSELDVTVYAPEGTTVSEIKRLAQAVARSPTTLGWDFPKHEAFVGSVLTAELSDEDREATPPNRYGYSRPIDGSLLEAGEVCVLSDDGKDIVTPADATWWRK